MLHVTHRFQIPIPFTWSKWLHELKFAKGADGLWSQPKESCNLHMIIAWRERNDDLTLTVSLASCVLLVENLMLITASEKSHQNNKHSFIRTSLLISEDLPLTDTHKDHIPYKKEFYKMYTDFNIKVYIAMYTFCTFLRYTFCRFHVYILCYEFGTPLCTKCINFNLYMLLSFFFKLYMMYTFCIQNIKHTC